MVMRAICGSADNLVGAEASRVTAPPIEKVARTQALFLYQIIRLLDGDVTLRAVGERHMSLLHTWLGELCNMRDNLDVSGPVGDLSMNKVRDKEWEVSNNLSNSFRLSLTSLVMSDLDLRGVRSDDYSDSILLLDTLRDNEGSRERRYDIDQLCATRDQCCQ